MHKRLLICNIFFIASIGGKTIQAKTTAAQQLIQQSSQPQKNYSTAQTGLSEGGYIVPGIGVTLPNGNNIGVNLAMESSVIKDKPVVARKDVDPKDEIIDPGYTLISNNFTTVKNASTNATNPLHKSFVLSTNITRVANDRNVSTNITDKYTTQPHKPLILSAEALARDKMNNLNIGDSNTPKVHTLKAGSHPGMIMPIVITILVVPMFAVVGYLVLKRGQEAWKNRHYKRMDFLLDGMYND